MIDKDYRIKNNGRWFEAIETAEEPEKGRCNICPAELQRECSYKITENIVSDTRTTVLRINPGEEIKVSEPIFECLMSLIGDQAHRLIIVPDGGITMFGY